MNICSERDDDNQQNDSAQSMQVVATCKENNQSAKHKRDNGDT